jgi:hypothetical protein
MASRSAYDHCSDKSEQSQKDREKSDQEDRDFLAEFTEARIYELEREGLAREHDTGPVHPDEIAEMMAALGASDAPADGAAPDPAPQEAEWLADFRALARKHQPFSTVQMVQILRVLNAVEDVALEACR